MEDDLRESLPIPKVNEDEAAQIASPMHPAHQGNFPADMRGVELSAGVRSFKIHQNFRHGFFPFLILYF
jgi:hypothetical protein